MASLGADASSPDSYDSFFQPSTPEFDQPTEDPSARPLTFPEVWTAIMKNPLSRMWAFNMQPPEPYELLLAQENGPFQKSFAITPPEGNTMYSNDLFPTLFYEIFAICHSLADGTHLGFALNSGLVDVMAAPFAPLDSAFADSTLSVNRLLCLSINTRMCVVEFCWLKCGALTIRYGPYNSLTSSTKSELRLYHSIYGFSPNDAQTLAACALVGIGAPDEDFLNAKFQNILLNDYYQIDMHDICYQDACVFCKSRGHNICDCPMPMRRRCSTGGEVNEIVPYKIPPGKSAWQEFPNAKGECAKKGTLIFNIKMRPHSPMELVVWSGLFPFDFKIKSGVLGHPTLQKHLHLSGHINPLATTMNSLKRDLFPNAQTLLLDQTPQNVTNAQNRVHAQEKRARLIENVTPPNAADGLTPANASGNENGKTVYNIQVIVQNGNVTGRNVVPQRNITSTSNEVRPIQNQQTEVIQSSTISPANTGTRVSAIRAPASSSTEPNSGSGSTGSGSDTKNNNKTWDCPECGIVIQNKKSNLNRHIDAIHRKKKARFQCDEQVCNKDEPGTMMKCTATFQTAYNLKRHRRNAHEKKWEKELKERAKESGTGRRSAFMSVAVGNE